MFKKIVLSIFTSILMLGTSFTAQATVLDFEGLTSLNTTGIHLGHQGYGGFFWNGGWYLYNDTTYSPPAVSGNYGLGCFYCSYLSRIPSLSSTPFDFNGVWIGQWYYNAPSAIQILGYDASSNIIGDTGWINIFSEPRYIAANFQDVTSLLFRHTGGLFFTMDDFTFSEAQASHPVPEPGTISLVEAGLFSIFYWKRKTSKIKV
ncbi:MAG: hypothetical protein HYS21_14180 [Deltaproteobacteria bacterium]|nr:hypothetical protein [Deltaproteobacteria bacterium]